MTKFMNTKFKKSLLISVLMITSTSAGAAYISSKLNTEETTSDFSYAHSYSAAAEPVNAFAIQNQSTKVELEQQRLDAQTELREASEANASVREMNENITSYISGDRIAIGDISGPIQDHIDGLESDRDSILNSINDAYNDASTLWPEFDFGTSFDDVAKYPDSDFGKAVQALNDIVDPLYQNISWTEEEASETATTPIWIDGRVWPENVYTDPSTYWSQVYALFGITADATTTTEITTALNTYIGEVSDSIAISISNMPEAIVTPTIDHVEVISDEAIEYILGKIEDESHVEIPTIATAPQIEKTISTIPDTAKLDPVLTGLTAWLDSITFLGENIFASTYTEGDVAANIIAQVQLMVHAIVDSALPPADFPDMNDLFFNDYWTQIEAQVTTMANNVEAQVTAARTAVGKVQTSVDAVNGFITTYNSAIDALNAEIAFVNTEIAAINTAISNEVATINAFITDYNNGVTTNTGAISDHIDSVNGFIGEINTTIDSLNTLISTTVGAVNALIEEQFGVINGYLDFVNETYEEAVAVMIFTEVYYSSQLWIESESLGDLPFIVGEDGDQVWTVINNYEGFDTSATATFTEATINDGADIDVNTTDPQLTETSTPTYDLTYTIPVREGGSYGSFEADSVMIWDADGTAYSDVTFTKGETLESLSSDVITITDPVLGTIEQQVTFDVVEYSVTIAGLNAGQAYDFYMAPNGKAGAYADDTIFGWLELPENAIKVNSTPVVHYMPNTISNETSVINLVDATLEFDVADGGTAWDITEDDFEITTTLASDATTVVTPTYTYTDGVDGVGHMEMYFASGLVPETEYTTTVKIRSNDFDSDGVADDADDFQVKGTYTWEAGQWPEPAIPVVSSFTVDTTSITKHEASMDYTISVYDADETIGENQAEVQKVELYQVGTGTDGSDVLVDTQTPTDGTAASIADTFDVSGLTLNTTYNYYFTLTYDAVNGSSYEGETWTVDSSTVSFTTVDQDPAVAPKDLTLAIDDTLTTTGEMTMNFSFTDPATPVDTDNTELLAPKFYYQEGTAAMAEIPTSNITVTYTDATGTEDPTITGPVSDDNVADVVYYGTAVVTGLTPSTDYTFRMDVDSNYYDGSTIEEPNGTDGLQTTVISSDTTTDKTLKLDANAPVYTNVDGADWADDYVDGFKYIGNSNTTVTVGYSFDIPADDYKNKNTVFTGFNVYGNETSAGTPALLTSGTDYNLTGSLPTTETPTGTFTGEIEFINLTPATDYSIYTEILWDSFDEDLEAETPGTGTVTQTPITNGTASVATEKAPAISAEIDPTDGFQFVSQEVIADSSTRASDIGEKVQATYSYHFWLPTDADDTYTTDLISDVIEEALSVTVQKETATEGTFEDVTMVAGTDYIITPTKSGEEGSTTIFDGATTGQEFAGTLVFQDLEAEETYKFGLEVLTSTTDPVTTNITNPTAESAELDTDLYAAKQGYFGTIASDTDGFDKVADSETDHEASFTYNFTTPADVHGYTQTDFSGWTVSIGTATGSLTAIDSTVSGTEIYYEMVPTSSVDTTTSTGLEEGTLNLYNLVQDTTYFIQLTATTTVGDVLSEELSFTTDKSAAVIPDETLFTYAFNDVTDGIAASQTGLSADFAFTLPGTQTGFMSTDFVSLDVYGANASTVTADAANLLTEGTDYSIVWDTDPTGVTTPATDTEYTGTISFGTESSIVDATLDYAQTYSSMLVLTTTASETISTPAITATTDNHDAELVEATSLVVSGMTDYTATGTFSVTVPATATGYDATMLDSVSLQYAEGKTAAEVVEGDWTDFGGAGGPTSTIEWELGSAPTTDGVFNGTFDLDGLTRATHYALRLVVTSNTTVNPTPDVSYSVTEFGTNTTPPIAPEFGDGATDSGIAVLGFTDTTLDISFNFTLPATGEGYDPTVFSAFNVYSSTGDDAIDYTATSTLTYSVVWTESDYSTPGTEPTTDTTDGGDTGNTFYGYVSFVTTANVKYNIDLGVVSTYEAEVRAGEISQTTDKSPIVEPTVTYVIDDSKTTTDTIVANFTFTLPYEVNTHDTVFEEVIIWGGADAASMTKLTSTDYTLAYDAGSEIPTTDPVTAETTYSGTVTFEGLTPGQSYTTELELVTSYDTGIAAGELGHGTTSDPITSSPSLETSEVAAVTAVNLTNSTTDAKHEIDVAFEFEIPNNPQAKPTTFVSLELMLDDSTTALVTFTDIDADFTHTTRDDATSGLTVDVYSGSYTVTGLLAETSHTVTAKLTTEQTTWDSTTPTNEVVTLDSDSLSTEVKDDSIKGYFGTDTDTTDGIATGTEATDSITVTFDATLPSANPDVNDTTFGSLVVTLDGATLTEGTDYTLTWDGTVDATTTGDISGTIVIDAEPGHNIVDDATLAPYEVGLELYTNVSSTTADDSVTIEANTLNLDSETPYFGTNKPTEADGDDDGLLIDTSSITETSFSANFSFTLPAEAAYDPTTFGSIEFTVTDETGARAIDATDITWDGGTAPAVGDSGSFSGVVKVTGLEPVHNYSIYSTLTYNSSTVTDGTIESFTDSTSTPAYPAAVPTVTMDTKDKATTTKDSIVIGFTVVLPAETGYEATTLTKDVAAYKDGSLDSSAKVTWDDSAMPTTSGTFSGEVLYEGLDANTTYSLNVGATTTYGAEVQAETPVEVTTDLLPAAAPTVAIEKTTGKATQNSLTVRFNVEIPDDVVDTDPTTFVSAEAYVDGEVATAGSTSIVWDGTGTREMPAEGDSGTYSGELTYTLPTANLEYDLTIGVTTNYSEGEVISNDVLDSTLPLDAKAPTINAFSNESVTTDSATFNVDITYSTGDAETTDTVINGINVYMGTATGELTLLTTDVVDLSGLTDDDAGHISGTITVSGLEPTTTYFFKVGVVSNYAGTEGASYADAEILSEETSVTTEEITEPKSEEEKENHTTAVVAGSSIGAIAVISIIVVMIL